MKLTKEQRDELAQELAHPYGRVELMCDGYKVVLHVERWKELSYRIVTYVNGEWRVVWICAPGEYPERKFLRYTEKFVHPARFRAQMLKLLGKRRYAKENYDKKIGMWNIDWQTGKAAINHLHRVCDSIEIISKGYAG